tara:strand:- start:19 stop:360 length:342 start_codon:yes stop_codon:yes gene_type:complete
MKSVCNSNLLILFLVILLTILIVYIVVNSLNKEKFSGYKASHFQNGQLNVTHLLNDELQKRETNLNERQLMDNLTLSNKHLSSVYEIRRPETIARHNNAKDKLCYFNLQGPSY